MDERTSEISEGFVILLLMLVRNYLSSHRHQRVDSSFGDNDLTKKNVSSVYYSFKLPLP